jgi:putative SbcD/Mre11-related phosphoesterase
MIEYVGKCLAVETGGKKTLVIGDLHFGFEEALNNAGVFVSRKMFEETVNYLERVFESVGEVDEVVLLGDVKHVFGSIMGQEWKEVLGFLDYLKEKAKKIVIIKGNHDKVIRGLANRAEVEVKDYYIVGEFCFLHGNRDFVENYDKKVKYWVLGHGHPAVKISEPGGVKVEKYKCFLVGNFKGKEVIVVPSFFDYSLGSDPRENDLGLIWPLKLGDFEARVVEDEELKVLDFGRLENIK